MATLSLGVIGFAKQSGLSNASGGTVVPPTPTFFVLMPTDATQLTLGFKSITDGYTRSLYTQVLTDITGKMDFTMPITPDVAGALVTGAMGGGDTVSGTVDPYTHTIALSATDLSYYTFQRSFAIFPNVYGGTAVFGENYLDCKIDSIAFSGKPKDVMTAKISAMAGNVRNAQGGTPAPTAPTFDPDAPFPFWNGTLALTVLNGGQSGTPTAGLTAFDVTFGNKSTEVFKFGKILPAGIVPGIRDVTGKLTFVPDSADQYYTPVTGISATADPNSPLRTGSLTLTVNAVTRLGVATSHSMQLSMPAIGYRTATIKVADGKPLEMSIDFTAQRSSGNDEFGAVFKTATSTAY